MIDSFLAVCTTRSSPDGQPVLVVLLADVHLLQLSHVPQVVALELLQPAVELLVGEVDVPLPLQAVDFQREAAADAAGSSDLLAAALGAQLLLLQVRAAEKTKTSETAESVPACLRTARLSSIDSSCGFRTMRRSKVKGHLHLIEQQAVIRFSSVSPAAPPLTSLMLPSSLRQ